MWVEMAVLWWNCSVLCRMWERGKEVVREWLWQPGLSRALRLVKLDAETCLLQKKWGILTRLWERRGAGRLQKDAFPGAPPPPHWRGQVSRLCDPPPRVTRARVVCLPCVWGSCMNHALHLQCRWGWNACSHAGLGRCVRVFILVAIVECRCDVGWEVLSQ